MFDFLVRYLGLEKEDGWVVASRFDEIAGPRGALRRARQEMSVRGAFGTWEHGTEPKGVKRFVPLLYVAEATELRSARDEVHRRVWSQGLVPLLVICTPDEIFISEGYDFSHEQWAQHVTQIPASAFAGQTSNLERLDAIERIKPSKSGVSSNIHTFRPASATIPQWLDRYDWNLQALCITSPRVGIGVKTSIWMTMIVKRGWPC